MANWSKVPEWLWLGQLIRLYESSWIPLTFATRGEKRTAMTYQESQYVRMSNAIQELERWRDGGGHGGAPGKFRQSFGATDLDAAGDLIVTHGLGTRYHYVTVYDDNGERASVQVTDIDETQISIRATQGDEPIQGTWNVVIIG